MMKHNLLSKLKLQPIIESQTGEMAMPRSLLFVPKKFRDPNGLPMTFTLQNASKYVSQKYEDSDLKYLNILGIKEMSSSDFLADLSLRACGRDTSQEFQKRRRQYHSDLAKILIPMLGDPKYVEPIRKLPLIRLRGGRWVSSVDSPIFFPGDMDDWSIPEGVDAMVVQSQQAKDSTISLLYSQLGVANLSRSEIGHLIIATHKSPTFRPSALEKDTLISQALFLFKANLKGIETASLWFAAEDGRYYKGWQLYQHAKGKYTATSMLSRGPNFLFLHREYFLAAEDSNEEWINWLQSSMGILAIPRLVRTTSPNGFELSPHFELIIRKHPSSEVLMLIREHWRYYSKWIEGDKLEETKLPSLKSSKEQLRQKLGAMPVECMGGFSRPLNQTYLPLKDLPTEATDRIPLLKIPEPGDERWLMLRYLGVGVSSDVGFYLRWLCEVANNSMDPENFESLKNLMLYLFEQIQARFMDNEELVK
jgi:hypothetical protein